MTFQLTQKGLIFLFFICFTFLFSCKKDIERGVSEDIQIENYIKTNNLTVTEKTSEGLRYILTSPKPTGVSLVKLQSINVNYTGKFLSGKAFDKGNFTFVLGAKQVVSGFDIGIAKMKVGEKAIIIFPSSLGYGDNDYSGIPGKSPLLFEIEIVSAK
jgi:FKBP-type peptidyl-prolyl cis-trans isomerase